jgi:hypothetical protein
MALERNRVVCPVTSSYLTSGNRNRKMTPITAGKSNSDKSSPRPIFTWRSSRLGMDFFDRLRAGCYPQSGRQEQESYQGGIGNFGVHEMEFGQAGL